MGSGRGDVWDYHFIVYLDPEGEGWTRQQFDRFDPSKSEIVGTQFHRSKCEVQPLKCCVEHIWKETGLDLVAVLRADSVSGDRDLFDYLVEKWKAGVHTGGQVWNERSDVSKVDCE
jgi:hypothetical protein